MKTDARPSPGPTSSFGPFVRRALSVLAGVVGPGFAAGLIAAGAGSRLAMRIMAVTSPDAVQGARTEAEAIVGEITVGGTIFLLLFGAVLGAGGGLLYLLIRRWLPGSGWKQGLAFGLVLLAATGRLLVSPDNIDFLLLEPAALAVAMFLALPLIFGMLFVLLHERMRGFFERARSRRVAWVTGVALLPVLAFGPLGLMVLVGGLVAFALRNGPAFWNSPAFSTAGYVILGVATIAGLTFTGMGVLEIL